MSSVDGSSDARGDVTFLTMRSGLLTQSGYPGSRSDRFAITSSSPCLRGADGEAEAGGPIAAGSRP